MNNIARPRLLIPAQAPAPEADKGGKKAADPRIQKLNTILGPKGIRADELLRKFDAFAAEYPEGTILPVYLTVILDGKGKAAEYKMRLGTESTSNIAKRKLKLDKLALKPNLKSPIATVDKKFIDELIAEKYRLSPMPGEYQAVFKSIVGSLSSCGIKYVS